MKKGQLRKGLALLAAVVMVLQMGSAMAFAAPIRRSVKPKAATTVTPGVVQVFSGSGGTFDGTSYDKGIVCYVVNTNTALDYAIKCATGANVKNVVYLIVEASETPPMPNITFEGFRSGTDEIIIVSSDYSGNTFVINGSQLKRSVPDTPSLAVAVVTGVTSLSNGVAANKAWAIHANSATAAYQAGDSVILKAIPLKGQTGVTYQWYSNTTGGNTTGAPIDGKTSADYSFTAAATAGTYYYCVISSGGSEVGKTDAQKITVQAAPEPACNKTAAIDSVVANPTSVQPDDADKTVTLTATVTLSGTCDLSDHTASDSNHGFTVAWSVSPAYTLGTPTATVSGNTLTSIVTMTVPKGASAGSVTATATLKRTGDADKTKTATVTVTRTGCNVPITGGAITGADTITLNPGQPAESARTYTFAPTYAAVGGPYECNDGHPANDHHKTYTWKISTDAAGTNTTVPGVSLGTSGVNAVISVNKSELTSGTSTFYLSAVYDNNIVQTKAITVQACLVKYTNIIFTDDASSMTVPDDAASVTLGLTPTKTGDCGLTGLPDHSHAVAWSLTSNPGGVAAIASSSDTAGTITLDRSKLSAGQQVTVKVQVTTNGAEAAHITKTIDLIVKRGVCNWVFTGISGKDSYNLSSSSGTLSYAVTHTGTCGDPAHNSTYHNPTWKLKSTVAGVSVNSTTGVVTLNRAQLSSGTTTFTLQATIQGVTKEKIVKVTKSSGGGSDSGSDSRTEAAENRQAWENLEDDVDDARTGETIRKSMGGNTEMPFYLWEALRGKSVTMELSFSGGYTWTVNGKTVKKLPGGIIYIPLDVKEIRHDKIESLARGNDAAILELRHDGSFYADMKLTYNVGSSYAGKTLYLYKYNESTGKLVYRTSAKANSDGDVTFPFTSASTYLISSKALYGETGTSGGGGTVGGGTGSGTGGGTGSLSPTLPASSVPASSSSGTSSEPSTSSEEPSSQSEVSSQPESSESPLPADTDPEPGEKKFPLIPVLLAAIAVVVVAIVLIAKRNKSYDI